MHNGKLVILYLDSDHTATIRSRELPNLEAIILPETRAHGLGSWLPKGVEVLQKQAINPTMDDMAVYHPPIWVLEGIEELTEEGSKIDIVIIGNNRGSGIEKARRVAPPLRLHTIIISNSGLDSREDTAYRQLGYTRFSTRRDLHIQLSEVVNLLSSNS